MDHVIFVAALDRKLLFRPYAIRFKKSGTRVGLCFPQQPPHSAHLACAFEGSAAATEAGILILLEVKMLVVHQSPCLCHRTASATFSLQQTLATKNVMSDTFNGICSCTLCYAALRGTAEIYRDVLLVQYTEGNNSIACHFSDTG